MKDIDELRRERARLQLQARELLDRAENEGRANLSGAEDAEWKAAMAGIRELDGEIEEREAERRAAGYTVDGDPPRPDPDDGFFRTALRPGEVRVLEPSESIREGWRFSLPSGVNERDLNLGRWLRGILTGRWDGAEAERRAMSGGADVAGGWLVPEPLAARIIDLARNKAVCFQAGARTVPMTSAALHLARVASDPTAYWRHENVAVTKSEMTFERVTLTARTLAAIATASVELVEDAENLGEVVERALSQALAVEVDRVALLGTGAAAEPLGVQNTTGIGSVALSASLSNYDCFVQAVQAVEEANHVAPTVVFAPRTKSELAQLKTGITNDNTPLKPPDAYAELRKLVSNQVPITLGGGTDSIAFVGDFSKMLIGIRTELRIEASREASDSSNNAFTELQVWIRGYVRGDVALEDAGAFAAITGIQVAA